MAANPVEKAAQRLNRELKERGKAYGKIWRSRIRDLLRQTFDALNARPLDGGLCRQLGEKIEKELADIDNETVDLQSPGERRQVKSDISEEPETKESERMREHSEDAARIGEDANSAGGEPRIGKANSGAGADSPHPIKEEPESVGLFDLIHVEVRTFFKIRACVRPPYIGKFVDFSDKYAERLMGRIERFLEVLTKREGEASARTEVEVGYREDLLPDMPDRNLVLSKRKKKG